MPTPPSIHIELERSASTRVNSIRVSVQFARGLLMRRLLLSSIAAASVLGLLAPATAQEANWPLKQPLTLIVPFGPGSSPDTMARAVAEEASKTLKQTIVIQNRAGASGNLGTDQIAKAKPDGYTFGVSITGPMVNNTVIYKSLPYNPVTDLTPLTLGVHQYNVLVVPASSSVKNLADLVAEMKKPDAKLNFPAQAQARFHIWQ